METTSPPLLRLNEDDHTYWLGSQRIPGLSELLKHFGYVDDTYYTEAGREIGRAVHAGTQAFDDGLSDHLELSQKEIVGRILAYQRFKAEKDFRVIHNEQILAHPYGTYACRIDRLGTFGEADEEALIELKCGSREAWHKLQTGGQDKCLPPAKRRRFALYLRPDETYNLVEHKDYGDGKLIEAHASGYWWKRNNGYRL